MADPAELIAEFLGGYDPKIHRGLRRELAKKLADDIAALTAPAPHADDVALVDAFAQSIYFDNEHDGSARTALLARLRQRDDRDTVLEECAMLANTMRGVDDATAAKIAAAILALKKETPDA